jgi:hypothetical protein
MSIVVGQLNLAPSVTCDMPFRLENLDKGNFGCDTVEISAPKSHFGPFFTHILVLFVKFGCTLSLKWLKSLENRPKRPIWPNFRIFFKLSHFCHSAIKLVTRA